MQPNDITFYQCFEADILAGRKTITIRDKSESHFKVGDILRVGRFEDNQYFCTIEVLGVSPITFDELTELHAKQENMGLDELKEVIRGIYPSEERFYVINFRLYMYKVAIFFRKTAKPNIFRELILKALSENYSEYLICSAFFQEPYQYKNNKWSGNFSTSNDMLSNLTCNCAKKINVYGLYSSNPFSSNSTWDKQFRIFCQKLVNYQCFIYLKTNNYINFNFYKFKNRSHSKIFLAKKNNKIDLAIIGSSNVSAGAFADRNQKEIWNHESDVIFWNEQSISDSIIEQVFESYHSEIEDSCFVMTYDESHYLNKISILDKLNSIENEISQHVTQINI